jgi:hypothetical protein
MVPRPNHPSISTSHQPPKALVPFQLLVIGKEGAQYLGLLAECDGFGIDWDE